MKRKKNKRNQVPSKLIKVIISVLATLIAASVGSPVISIGTINVYFL